jgi:uncharacterized protein YndB with AHSA1/START domain
LAGGVGRFDAPLDLMWQPCTDPQHVKAWDGSVGSTLPMAKMGGRVGGVRLVCMEMQTPNGPMQMWFVGEFRGVIKASATSIPSRWPRWAGA